MNILSVFDGMSCGRIALDRVGIEYDNYYASEIDKYAIQVAQKNYPDTIQLGDVTELKAETLPEIDLLIGGSPCQGFSLAGKKLNFDDPRSALFFEFVRLLEELEPKYFLLENVKMKKEWEDVITKYLEVSPIEINSALVSAQNRKRLYWTNIPYKENPRDKGIMLQDILEQDATEPMLSNIYGGFKEKKPRVHYDKSVTLRTPAGGGHIPSVAIGGAFRSRRNKAQIRKKGKVKQLETRSDMKSNCLTSVQTDSVAVFDNIRYRKLTPLECERLQTVPDNYTEGVSNTQRYKMLGNSFTVDIIAHILQGIKETNG